MTGRFDLDGKRILLVGATGVLGRTFAKALVEAGAEVALADLPDTDVLSLAEALGSKARALEIDITDEGSVVNGIAWTLDNLGGLDGMVANAALTGEALLAAGDAFAPVESYPLEVWRRTLDVNLTGTFLLAREAGKAMKAHGGGSIVTMASIYGVVAPDHSIYQGQPFASFPGYAASKAGVIGLTRWLATWWAKDGIRVNSLSPGGVFNDHDPAFAEAYGRRTPMGRMAEPDEVAGMLIYLLSDASSYCTGQNYLVDGGLSAW